MPLTAKRILIAEDLYLRADDMACALKKAGAFIVGPFARGDEAREAARSGHADGGILDIGLSGGVAYPCAMELKRRRLPFVFVSGYPHWTVPADFAMSPFAYKPLSAEDLVSRVIALFAPPGRLAPA